MLPKLALDGIVARWEVGGFLFFFLGGGVSFFFEGGFSLGNLGDFGGIFWGIWAGGGSVFFFCLARVSCRCPFDRLARLEAFAITSTSQLSPWVPQVQPWMQSGDHSWFNPAKVQLVGPLGFNAIYQKNRVVHIAWFNRFHHLNWVLAILVGVEP